MSKHLLYLISVFFLTSFAPAEKSDEVTKLVEELSKANGQKERISYSLTYNLYAGENNKRHVSTLKGLLIKNNEYKYTQLGEVESLKSTKYFISVDTEDKVLVLSDNNEKTHQGFDFDQLRKYLALCKQFGISRINAHQSKLSLELKGGEISKLDIYFANDFLIQKICLTYPPQLSNDTNDIDGNEPQQLEINFSETGNIIQDDPRLKVANYCIVKNGEWKATGKYAGFQFINNLIKK